MIWVLIDLSYLAHRARHALRGLAWNDYPTGVIFGFFEQLRSICMESRISSNKVAIFHDSKRSHRRRQFPSYKSSRRKAKRTPKEHEEIRVMWDQVKILQRRILPDMGLRVYRQTGLESDDLIAYAASQMNGELRQAVIVSSDQDLFQCISESVHWYDPGRGIYWTPESFKREKGIEADRWGTVKALAGCSTDSVPGIPDVGEITAIRFLKGLLGTTTARYQAIISPKGSSIYERNQKLVVLPHSKTKPFELIKPEYDAEAFFKHCERYGIVSYLEGKQRKQWLSFFNRTRDRVKRRKGGRRETKTT